MMGSAQRVQLVLPLSNPHMTLQRWDLVWEGVSLMRGMGEEGWMEWGWPASGVVYISQRGYSIEIVDNGKNILFHLEGMDCIFTTPKQPTFQPQQLHINWLHCY